MKKENYAQIVTAVYLLNQNNQLKKRLDQMEKPKAKVKYITDEEYKANDWSFNMQMRLGQLFCLSVLVYFSYLKWWA